MLRASLAHLYAIRNYSASSDHTVALSRFKLIKQVHNMQTPSLLQSAQTFILLTLILAFFSGCSSLQGQTITIYELHLIARESVDAEITPLLEELGYHWLPVYDPNFGHKVKISEQNGEFRMLFQADDRPDIQIKVHSLAAGDHIGLHFFQAGARHPDKDAIRRFHLLEKRILQEFEAENVRIGSPALTP